MTMQVFKTDKKRYLKNELKSWLWILFFGTLLHFIFLSFFPMAQYNLSIGVFVFILLKIGNTLTQYHISEIRVDRENKQLIFALKSIIAGEKIKTYNLEPAGSELVHNSGLASLLSSPFILIIYLPYKDKFRITDRYGFSKETLTAIDDTFKSLNNLQYNLPK